jgi:hypothetical protein
MSGQLLLRRVSSNYVDDELTIHEQRECDRIPYQEQKRKHAQVWASNPGLTMKIATEIAKHTYSHQHGAFEGD